MTPVFFVSTALELAERGILPDAAVRAGIRALLERQLAGWSRLAPAERRTREDRLVAAMRAAPIAPFSAANEANVELPAEFFRLVLGPRMKYSCGHWGEDCTTLADAERDALEITLRRARIADGARILELGCGWGSLALEAAARFPNARILGITSSRSQCAFIEARARERGLANVRVQPADAAAFEPGEHFDRVVSVEMFEHLRNYESMLRRIARWLEPDGSLFLHVFCHRTMPYTFSPEGPDDWMGRHFFTEGLMPSEQLFDRFTEDLAPAERWRWSGTHYRRTAQAWLRNLDASRDAVLTILRTAHPAGEERRWLERWRLVFLACAELFGARGGSEWGVAHLRLEPVGRAAVRA